MQDLVVFFPSLKSQVIRICHLKGAVNPAQSTPCYIQFNGSFPCRCASRSLDRNAQCACQYYLFFFVCHWVIHTPCNHLTSYPGCPPPESRPAMRSSCGRGAVAPAGRTEAPESVKTQTRETINMGAWDQFKLKSICKQCVGLVKLNLYNLS